MLVMYEAKVVVHQDLLGEQNRKIAMVEARYKFDLKII